MSETLGWMATFTVIALFWMAASTFFPDSLLVTEVRDAMEILRDGFDVEAKLATTLASF